MESKKRERAANFNTAEVELLVGLVDEHKHIVENKKTDAVTNKDKDAAWKKIESSFNSCGISSSIRTWKTLKLKYESIKKTTKKKSSVQRQEMYRTGGGPSNGPGFNEVEEKVLSICSNITGLETRHDSDTITLPTICVHENIVLNANNLNSVELETNSAVNEEQSNTHADIKIPDMNESLILEINVEDNESQKENKREKWHPKALKTRVSNILKPDTVTKASVTSRLDKLSAARLELVQLQKETTLKQHQFIEEEHKLKMIHLANEEARRQEIHELTIQKLKNTPGSRLDKLSAARLELVQLQKETTLKQQQFIEEEHKLKMIHLANEEARRQEIHELTIQKLKNTLGFNGNT